MIEITNTAQQHFQRLLLKQKPGTQIRIFVINPGTNNAECKITYCLLHQQSITDKKLTFKNISVYIDHISYPYIIGSKIDLVKINTNTQLTIYAPNVQKQNIKKTTTILHQSVEAILKQKINPILAMHGGFIELHKITKNKLALIKFKGGCNGCSMVQQTFKEAIEKELLNSCKELKGVCDITNHKHSRYSFS